MLVTEVATQIIFHEVDNVDHWLSSPRRVETFGPLGITVRTFIDPDNASRRDERSGPPVGDESGT